MTCYDLRDDTRTTSDWTYLEMFNHFETCDVSLT
eukprot:CAMPEP_0177618872 /NCGR_PEP_ID=MMETSP0419_2-20121207/25879_1 /TAXON_ID=582737 /ORGANISM="Tetraselmis sp., Strain GSL018" /LENGTH=33 /DNA_ID= /DNA_START= /DNA_END= /DNA_ORIENTATION=